MKKTFITTFFAGIIMIIMVLATHSTEVKADDGFPELTDYLTSKLEYYNDSWLEQSKQYYNLLQVCDGLKKDMIAYGDIAYIAGYDRKDITSINLCIQYYDDCKQTAIDRLNDFTKRSFLVKKKETKDSAKKLAGLFEALPDGNTYCTQKFETGILDRKANPLYNREAAVSFAKEHAYDGYGLCAEFVSRCLAAGGLDDFAHEVNNKNVYEANKGFKNVGTLGDTLLKNKKYVVEEIKVSGKTLNKNNYPEVEIGDVVIWKMQEGAHNRLHTAIISGFDSKGNALFCAHNSSHKDDSMGVNIYCGSYKSVPNGVTKYRWDADKEVYRVMTDMYLYHIDY